MLARPVTIPIRPSAATCPVNVAMKAPIARQMTTMYAPLSTHPSNHSSDRYRPDLLGYVPAIPRGASGPVSVDVFPVVQRRGVYMCRVC